MFRHTVFAMAIPAVAFCSAIQAYAVDKPNVVIILADDMGWGDPKCYNPASKTPTPAIDRLAAEGMLFDDAHTPSSVCTPTRYTLLTGRYCWRTRLKSSVLDGFSPPLISESEWTIPKMLSANGYATACMGKWHLGMQWTRKDGTPELIDRADKGFRPGTDIDFSVPLQAGPLTNGFDHFFGISASLDMPPYCWIEDDHAFPAPDTSVETAKDTIFLNQTGGVAHCDFALDQVLPTLKVKANQWLRKQHQDNPSQPFFLYLPLPSPHLPVAPSNSFKGKSGAGEYADFVMETDDFVGSIDVTLKELGIEQNTLIIFSSDNGGLWHQWHATERDDRKHYRPTPRGNYNAQHGHFSNAHLRGTKADLWEGGHRVPLICKWPKVVAAGSRCSQIVELTDVAATLIEAADLGNELSEDESKSARQATAVMDSHSFLKNLRGQTNRKIRDFSVHHSLRGDFAIRRGDWKLISIRGSGGFSRPRQISPPPGEPTGQLYNLHDDPSETKNVWADNPKIVNQLRLQLAEFTRPIQRKIMTFKSTADGSRQQAVLLLPQNMDVAAPLVVSLHSWSADMYQQTYLERLIHDRGWALLKPNFRGRNDDPQACGSELAQQDILDATDVVLKEQNIDDGRVFLTGTSGGGHMSMMMAAKFPKRWRAVSAWVGISDLKAWHHKHKGSKYGNMMEQCCGGAPGQSAEVDRQYRLRSPIHFLSNASNVALDLNAGIHDGHTGSVPIKHSLDAFNVIAKANETEVITNAEIQELSARNGRLKKPHPGDEGFDPTFSRQYYLRRFSGKSRITVFEGGHEGIAEATMDWLEKHLNENE